MSGLWLVQTAADQLAAARDGLETPMLARAMGMVAQLVLNRAMGTALTRPKSVSI